MAAADGTYRIFRRDAGDYAGQPFTDTGESYTGAIDGAFAFAASLQNADPSHVYWPYVGYDVLTNGAAPNPAVNDASAPQPIVNNRCSAIWEQNQAELDYLNNTYGEQTWALQSYGPG